MRRTFSRHPLSILIMLSSCGLPLVVQAAPAELRLQPVEREALLSEDLAAPDSAPLRYAEVRDIAVDMQRGVANAGTWADATSEEGEALRRWSFTITTPGALSQDFGFAHLFLPQGARLSLRDAQGRVVAGPYSDNEVAANRRFQTAFVAGDTATLEILVAASLQQHVTFALDRVAPAHRPILGSAGSAFAKSGSCNVDVRCPQGAPYPDQINSVAHYSFNGFLCTGALINNASGDRTANFLTANHCIDNQAEASNMVFYWKYENPTCRVPGSGASGIPIPLNGNSIAQTGGADLRATRSASDFTLVRLRTAVPTAASGFLAGWDRRNIAPPSAFTIHHPQGDEKRISFDNGPLQIFDQSAPGIPFGNSFLRVVDYELGTTEGGSSGAPLFSPERRIVGQLAGGAALCSVPDGDDYFGRLATSFIGGGTAATRLSDWLDPGASNQQTLDGASLAGGGGGVCTAPTLTSPAVARAGEPVNLDLALPAGSYRVEWDVDGDGIFDRTRLNASGSLRLQPVYPTEVNQSIIVRVTDNNTTTACNATLQRALVVDGPMVSVTAGAAQQICGDGDAVFDAGERWRVPVTLRNDGGKELTGGHAVFAPTNTALARLENPALAIPSLGPNGVSFGSALDIAIPTTAACGASTTVKYLGAVDPATWSVQRASFPIGYTIGGGGPCNVVSFCPAQIVPITPQIGLFGSPNRFGNGIGTFITDNADSDPPVFFGAWFTGRTNRSPIWYTLQGSLVDNRADLDIRQFRRTGQTPFAVSGTVVGNAQATYINPNEYLLFFNVGGRAGAERNSLALTDTSLVPDRTGAWINPGESGSGYVVDDHRNAGAPEQTIISFIYDTLNEPTWTFGAKLIQASGANSDYFEVHCPTCPSLVDFLDTRVFAGVLSPVYNSRTTGSVSTNFSTASPVSIQWIRNNLPIEMITTPRP